MAPKASRFRTFEDGFGILGSATEYSVGIERWSSGSFRISTVREISKQNGSSHRFFLRRPRPAATPEPLTAKQAIILRTMLSEC